MFNGRYIKLKLIPVAEVKDVIIHTPEKSFVSFFNSPYHSHKENTAVDIYINSREYDFAPSPVEGRIKQICEVKTPKSRYFTVNDKEQLIILELNRKNLLYIRLLHIIPNIKVGKKISIGDELGFLVRSGFFDFWTDYHIHVEVRGASNLIRAKGSLPINPIMSKHYIIDFRDDVFKGLEVFSVKENYTLLKAKNLSRIGNFYGVGCSVGKEVGILDGGIPHYSYGGIYLPHSNSVKIGEKVRLGKTIIGKVERLHRNLAFFQGNALSVHINEIRVKGLSLYLFLYNQKTIKIIPEKPKKLPLKRGESVKISLKRLGREKPFC